MTKKGYRYEEYKFRQFHRTIEKEQLTREKRKEIQTKIRETSQIKETQITYKTRPYSKTVYRQKGRFVSIKKYEEQQRKNKEIPEQEKDGFYKKLSYKTEFYRASVAINGIPVARQYYSATFVRIAKLKDINIDDMKEELLKKLEVSLHYKKTNFWFDWKIILQIQEPKPYFGKERGDSYEYHKTNK